MGQLFKTQGIKIMKKISVFILALAFSACSPFEEDDIVLPATPEAPSFSVEPVAGDPNSVVVKDLSSGFFSRVWSFPGGTPSQSTEAIDTVFYQDKGDYTITLYAAKEGGGGVSQLAQTLNIASDAQPACNPQTALLTGDCGPNGKCWTLTTAAGAVKVGPTPGSAEYYSSPVNGLQGAQYDDAFCFYFTGGHFQYNNNGQTVDPWNGYQAVPFAPPTNQTWFIAKGAGQGGSDQIVLPTGAFLGVWDSGPLYDIVSLTENELIVRSNILNTSNWFELTFVKK